MKLTIGEVIEAIKKARGFKTRKELAEYLSKKYNTDVYKLGYDELVGILWQEYIEIEMEG